MSASSSAFAPAPFPHHRAAVWQSLEAQRRACCTRHFNECVSDYTGIVAGSVDSHGGQWNVENGPLPRVRSPGEKKSQARRDDEHSHRGIGRRTAVSRRLFIGAPVARCDDGIDVLSRLVEDSRLARPTDCCTNLAERS